MKTGFLIPRPDRRSGNPEAVCFSCFLASDVYGERDESWDVTNHDDDAVCELTCETCDNVLVEGPEVPEHWTKDEIQAEVLWL